MNNNNNNNEDSPAWSLKSCLLRRTPPKEKPNEGRYNLRRNKPSESEPPQIEETKKIVSTPTSNPPSDNSSRSEPSKEIAPETEKTISTPTSGLPSEISLHSESSENILPKTIPTYTNPSTSSESNIIIQARNMEEAIQNIVEKWVPQFYGQPDVDTSEVRFFIDACERVKAKYDGDNANLRIALEAITFRLRGSAYVYFRDSPPPSIEEFCKVIGEKYLQKFSIDQLRDRLHSAKQNKNETCEEFGNRIKSLALDYDSGVKMKYGNNNAFPQPLLNSMQQDTFVRGLRNTVIQASLLTITGKTMKELVELASNLELKLSSSHFGTETPIKPTIQTIQCQLCDRTGHQARECQSFKKSFAGRNTQYQHHSNFQQSNKFCRYCKENGHEINGCRKKRYADERQSNNNIPHFTQNSFTHMNQPNFANKTNYSEQQFTRPPQNWTPYRPPHQQTQHIPNYPPARYNNQPNQSRNWQMRSPSHNSPKKVTAYSPGNRNMNTQNLERGMANLSINYINDEQLNVEENQENFSGLTDEQ